MASETGEEYLQSLINSNDPKDKELADNIIQGQQTGVANSPLDRVPDVSSKIKDLTPPPTSTIKKKP